MPIAKKGWENQEAWEDGEEEEEWDYGRYGQEDWEEGWWDREWAKHAEEDWREGYEDYEVEAGLDRYEYGGGEYMVYVGEESDAGSWGDEDDEGDWMKKINLKILYEDFVTYKNADRGLIA